MYGRGLGPHMNFFELEPHMNCFELGAHVKIVLSQGHIRKNYLHSDFNLRIRLK